MTNTDFAIASNKLMYYMFNFSCKPIEVAGYEGTITKSLPSFFEVFDDLHLRAHLAGKWNANYESYGAYGVFTAFYGELDNKLRSKVLRWINENFKHDDTYGINISELTKN